jgi:hypothetical protein
MSTTGMLWSAMLDIDRVTMLPLVLFKLVLINGLTALLAITNIAADLYVRCVVSC